MKIAFCFLTYSDLEQPEIWEDFFKSINDDNKFKIIIHPKYKNSIRNEYFKLKEIPHNYHIITKHKTDISIVYATFNLIKCALLDKDINKDGFV